MSHEVCVRGVHGTARRRAATLALAFGALAAGWSAAPLAQTPARDRGTPSPTAAGTGVISGYVVAADTGRPIKRARIVVTSAQLGARGRQGAAALLEALRGRGPGGRAGEAVSAGADPVAALAATLRVVQAAQTDDQGRYEVKGLAAGRYLVSASKTGFVTVNFGQRRPLRPGTPIELGDGQRLEHVNFVLPRGSVIAGHIFDEDGEPLARAGVTVWRYQYQGGERRLVAAGSDQTDDRGQYRVYGLPPGEYVVSAVARLFARPVERLLAFAGQAPPAESDEDTLGYAPTYYPGVTTAAQATPVAVGLGQEAANVDFQLQLVKLARVSGVLYGSDGTPLAGGVVLLQPDEAGAARADTITARARADGAFTIDNVPPGRYTLFARNRPGRDQPPDYAVVPVVVAGADLGNVSVVLTPGATVSGTIAFDPNASTTPRSLAGFRVTVPALDPLPVAGNQPARVNEDGTFTVAGIPPGRHAIRAPSPPAPWVLQAVIVDGRDVTDTPIELGAGQRVTGVQVVFTDRVTELVGSVRDERGDPVIGFTVIAFSTDPATWRAQSRTIHAAQPDQTGAFRIRGLPPGSYYLVATDDVEPGEWFDAAFLQEAQKSAVRVTLAEGQTTSQDLTVKTGGGPVPF
jgi:hypothetical protein